MSDNKFFPELDAVKGKNKKDPNALNVSASFDIETTSFYAGEGRTIPVKEFLTYTPKRQAKYEKRACLCAWGFGLNGQVVFGRTWKEFIALLEAIRDHYGLDPASLILPVYIHNEAYEFQWIRKRLEWVSVFAVKSRYPIRALCSLGIEFRDSLILSGMSLNATAKGLRLYPVEKLVGDWDYEKLRGSETLISDDEWAYLRNDNLVVMSYVQELLEEFKSVNKIPMTKTAFVREDVRRACFWGNRKSHKKDKDHQFRDYQDLMKSLSLDYEEYMIAKQAFMGGFTHASAINVGCVIKDVTSFDICSSYPAVICSEKFPMTKGKKVEPKTAQEFRDLMKTHCCIMEVTFYDVESTQNYEHIISLSKCSDVYGEIVDNGRIVRAKELTICITNVDFECIERFYTFSRVKILSLYAYVKGYLPKAIVERTITYFEQKTTLKGVEGKEAEYARSKELLNSIYGCMVQSIVHEDIKYTNDGEWIEETKNVREEIKKYNESKTRFLSYLWGIFITAYARRNIMSAILESGVDHIYSDTDSEKMMNPLEHYLFFERYNALITRKIRLCLEYNGIDPKRASPRTIEGKEKPLGVFEIDARYKNFLTLGAKRYAVQYEDDTFSLTISGVNKKTAVPKVSEEMKKKGLSYFDFFKFGAVFDRDMCGKNVHTYIDDETRGVLIDCDGKENHYEELSSTHLEETSYQLTASEDYLEFLNGIQSIPFID